MNEPSPPTKGKQTVSRHKQNETSSFLPALAMISLLSFTFPLKCVLESIVFHFTDAFFLSMRLPGSPRGLRIIPGEKDGK